MLIVEDYNERRQQEREDALTAAYLTAYWQRVERMPGLKQVLEDSRPVRTMQQTLEQMFAMVKRLQAELAGEEG